MIASHFTEEIKAVREKVPHLPPRHYSQPLSVSLYQDLFPMNEGELRLFLTEPDPQEWTGNFTG